MLIGSHFVTGILAHHQGEDLLMEAGLGTATILTAIHEDVVLPTMPMEVTVQHHLSLRQQPGEQHNIKQETRLH